MVTVVHMASPGKEEEVSVTYIPCCKLFQQIVNIFFITFLLIFELTFILPPTRCSDPYTFYEYWRIAVALVCILSICFASCIPEYSTLLILPYVLKVSWDMLTTICFLFFYVCIWNNNEWSEERREAVVWYTNFSDSDTGCETLSKVFKALAVYDKGAYNEVTETLVVYFCALGKCMQLLLFLLCWMNFRYLGDLNEKIKSYQAWVAAQSAEDRDSNVRHV